VTPSAVAAAATPLPQPLAISAPVTVDFANMALIVRRPDAAGGHAALLWREAHAALVQAEEKGWPSSTRFVYGSAPGHYQFAHAIPGPNLTLLFAFTVGTPAAQVYAELVSKPGLSAFVTADKSTRRFLGVSFRNSVVTVSECFRLLL
jgi:hypothetical protein